MTQDEIIEMWKNSGDLEIIGMPYSKIEAFAKLVAAKEREACAKVCEGLKKKEQAHWSAYGFDGSYYSASDCATAIRARGEA
jgi:hypothetical protein